MRLSQGWELSPGCRLLGQCFHQMSLNARWQARPTLMVSALWGVISDDAPSSLLQPKGSALAGSDSTFEDWTEMITEVYCSHFQVPSFSRAMRPCLQSGIFTCNTRTPAWAGPWQVPCGILDEAEKAQMTQNRDRQRARVWVTHKTNPLQTAFLPVGWRLRA